MSRTRGITLVSTPLSPGLEGARMTHPCYTSAWRLDRLGRGPLGPYLGAHSEFLRSRGYSCDTIRSYLQTLQRFNTWLSHQGLLVRSLSEQVIEDFLRSQSPRYRTARNRAPLRLLLQQLRTGGVVTTLPPEPPATPSDLVIREFMRHLQEERGFSPETIAYYVPLARRFLKARFGAGKVRLRTLAPKDVTDFVG